MLKINKKVEYALMGLKFMAQKPEGELTSAREICAEFNAPFDTMAKVMQILNNHGVLVSVKGIKGGYRLAMPLTKISYGQLQVWIEGEQSEHFCKNHKGMCDLYEKCNIVTPVELLNSKIQHFLHGLTLEELFRGELPTLSITQEIQQ
jgi:Rrf2 family protein